jgi:hypothetical protein
MTRGVLEYDRGTRFESTSLVRFGRFELDLSSRELKREANCVRLQTQPFDLRAHDERLPVVTDRREKRDRPIADDGIQHVRAELRGDRDSPMKL